MTKADLAERIYERLSSITGLTRKESLTLVDQVFELVKDVLVSEGELKIARFGVFAVWAKEARRGRNPQTGEELTIEPRRILSFSASQVLKQRLNGITYPTTVARRRVLAQP